MTPGFYTGRFEVQGDGEPTSTYTVCLDTDAVLPTRFALETCSLLDTTVDQVGYLFFPRVLRTAPTERELSGTVHRLEEAWRWWSDGKAETEITAADTETLYVAEIISVE